MLDTEVFLYKNRALFKDTDILFTNTELRRTETIRFQTDISRFILPLQSEDQVKLEKFNSDFQIKFLFLVSSFQKCIALKGLKKVMRLPETLKCYKSQMWRPSRLRLHQPGYLIR